MKKTKSVLNDSETNMDTLLNLISVQTREMERMNTRICDLTSENNALKNSLVEKESAYAALQEKYIALQEKYIIHIETSNV